MTNWLRINSGRVRLVSIGVILLSIMIAMRALPVSRGMDALREWIESLGLWGPVVFGLIYVLATVAMIPGSLLTLVAGATFGLILGTITVSIGSTTGAALAFLIARYLARDKVETIAKERPRFRAVDQAIDEGGWKIVAMLRLSPAIPFNLQNYLYGLTSIRFWPCTLASWVAMLPGTFLYVYLGHVAGTAVSQSGETSLAEWSLRAVGLLATIVVTVYITRMAQSKLQDISEISTTGNDSESIELHSQTDDETVPLIRTFLTAFAALLFAALAVFSLVDPQQFGDLFQRVVPLNPSSVHVTVTSR